MSETENHHPDIREQGKAPDGSPIYSDQRLFMQLLAYGGSRDIAELMESLLHFNYPSVLYVDANDPQGVALLTFNTDPDFFVNDLRRFLNGSPFAALTPKPEYTMLGRTYTIGYESDLEHVLVNRSRERVLHPDSRWSVWYPLRRTGAFQDLDRKQQMEILGEHGRIGQAFGAAGYAQDIRLACFGLDKEDNDFVIGLLGRELHPLSAVVETMRKTTQTKQYISKLGPFFVGKAVQQKG